jgi:hypothetical protein
MKFRSSIHFSIIIYQYLSILIIWTLYRRLKVIYNARSERKYKQYLYDENIKMQQKEHQHIAMLLLTL